jgi:metallo-beta-lactamase family protein
MKIQFHGGAQTVTGSQHLVTVNGSRILLECGLYQGHRAEAYQRNLNFEYDPAEVDVMLLSHAHIDHSGNIPNLYKNGFRKSIYTTTATADLCQILLRDSAYLNEKDVAWVNKKRAARHEELLEPLYTIEDAEKALRQFVGVHYNRAFEVAPGVMATFQEAGHILGSAGILLEVQDGKRKIRFGFSGDIGRYDMPILRDPQPFDDLDALVMESTYGDRLHSESDDSDRELADLVKGVCKRKGKLIIPSFAVGRTQRLVYKLHRLQEQGMIPEIPMFVDSPMACNAMEVFRAHPENFDRETYEHFLNDHEDPFTPKNFACIRSVDGSKKLNALDGPHIVISASGMMEGGRVLHHLRNNIKNPDTTVLFVGFAAPHTLARRMMDGAKRVKIFGEEYPVECDVRIMPYFSAHADRDGLLGYVDGLDRKRLKQIFLVHGELEQATALKKALTKKKFRNVHIPARGETHSI